MKKIIFTTLAFVAIFGMIFVSCKPDESSKHEYTQEELDEIARQDSLKQIIPADYIFTQNVTLPITKGYAGMTVQLCPDTTKLLELLDYKSVAELVTALGTLEGTPPDMTQTGNDLIFYAYNFSTKYEVDDPSNTNSFGHWFDASGDVCTWGDNAYLFLEKQDTFSLKFTLGLYPAHPAIGDTYKIVEAIKYDKYKVAFLFTVTIGPEEVIPPATVVARDTLKLNKEYDENYATTALDFNVSNITTKIGVAPALANLYGINTDGTVKPDHTATNGFFFNASGDVCSWGSDGCAMFVEIDETNNKLNVGQFPAGVTVGETYTARIAFINDLKQYNIVIKMTVTEAALVYPETTLETTINLTSAVDSVGTDVWVDNVLALDSAAIQTAIGCGPSAATIYGVSASTDSLYIKGLTGNNGCWFNAAGDVCKWGAETISMYLEYRKTTQEVGFGQMPATCKRGTTYYSRLAFVNGTKRAEVKVAMTIN